MFNLAFLLQAALIMVGLVFLHYSLPKLMAGSDEFASIVGQYRILPGKLVKPFAFILPFIELLAVITLLIPFTTYFGMAMVLSLLIVFQIALAKVIITGEYVGCGCAGQARKFDKSGRKSLYIAFGRNVFMLVGSGLAWANQTGITSIWPFVVIVGVMAVVAAAYYLRRYIIYRHARTIPAELVVEFAPVTHRRHFLKTIGAVGALAGLVLTGTVKIPTALAWTACLYGAGCTVVSSNPASGWRGGCAACGSPVPCYTCYARSCRSYFMYCEFGPNSAPCSAIELCTGYSMCWSAPCPPNTIYRYLG